MCGIKSGFNIVTILLLSAVWTNAELHPFVLQDGRALEAEIVDYNARLGKVTLKRQDGKRVSVKPSVFVEADQQFIREWELSKAFNSDRFLKISCDDKTVEKWEKEEWGTITYDGTPEKELMKTTQFERIGYEVTFHNMNPTALDGIRMEYWIFFEQSEESSIKPEVIQKSKSGQTMIPELTAKKKLLVDTDPVDIFKDSIDRKDLIRGDDRIGGRGEVHGIRGRLYMKTASGNEIMREFCHPASLSPERFPWKTISAASADTGKRKKKKF
jgi:hypothetical protein